jgi:NADH-ubiquinone oxidoreductase chain 6
MLLAEKRFLIINVMLNLYIISDMFNGFSISFLDIIVIISLFSGIFIIISKNPIVSVLYLILLFSSISCYLIFIGVKFIGISYLLVYVGAVSILFLFILMLINIRVSELISDTNNNIPLAVLAILGFFIPFSSLLPEAKITVNNNFLNSLLENIINISYNNFDKQISYVSSNNWDGNIVDVSDIISIGNIMYTSYSLWLIITSIILLLAMVGAIVITIKQRY